MHAPAARMLDNTATQALQHVAATAHVKNCDQPPRARLIPWVLVCLLLIHKIAGWESEHMPFPGCSPHMYNARCALQTQDRGFSCLTSIEATYFKAAFLVSFTMVSSFTTLPSKLLIVWVQNKFCAGRGEECFREGEEKLQE